MPSTSHFAICSYPSIGTSGSQPIAGSIAGWVYLAATHIFFSPEAAKQLKAFVNFWEGVGCAEPTNLPKMETII